MTNTHMLGKEMFKRKLKAPKKTAENLLTL